MKRMLVKKPDISNRISRMETRAAIERALEQTATKLADAVRENDTAKIRRLDMIRQNLLATLYRTR